MRGREAAEAISFGSSGKWSGYMVSPPCQRQRPRLPTELVGARTPLLSITGSGRSDLLAAIVLLAPTSFITHLVIPRMNLSFLQTSPATGACFVAGLLPAPRKELRPEKWGSPGKCRGQFVKRAGVRDRC